MSGFWILSQKRKPPVPFFLLFLWFVLMGAALGCLVSRAGDPPDGSPLYYLGVRPLAALAPLLAAIWLLLLLAPHWSKVHRMQKVALLTALIAAAGLCAWVFYTVWRVLG